MSDEKQKDAWRQAAEDVYSFPPGETAKETLNRVVRLLVNARLERDEALDRLAALAEGGDK